MSRDQPAVYSCLSEADELLSECFASTDQVVGRDQLSDAEISLVDRIADVDDERRRATARLQKAWQTHQDEVDARLRRQGWKSAIALLLLTLVGAGIVFLAFSGFWLWLQPKIRRSRRRRKLAQGQQS